MKTLVLPILPIFLFVGVTQAEITVRNADYWRGRPIARLDLSKVNLENRRYYASSYGWTSREPISRRQYRRLERRRYNAQRHHRRALRRINRFILWGLNPSSRDRSLLKGDGMSGILRIA